jgi:Acyl-CoA dehydrogenase, C-terminal domain
MDEGDRELFERSIRQATESHSGQALDDALAKLGWLEALSAEPQTAISILFELQGAGGATSSAVNAVLGSALGAETAEPMLVVLPTLGHWEPPGEITGEGLSIRGIATSSAVDRPVTNVVARHDGSQRLVEVRTSDLARRPVEGLDPRLGLVEVAGDAVALIAERDLGAGDWSQAIALGRIALGHQLLGATRAMLDLARRHALDRIQFGQPIGKFQAIRHRLADTLVAIEAAEAALGSAWEERSPDAAAIAKALAGRSGRIAARHCQQVLAGIGFTTEHDFNRYFRRVLVLDQMLGSGRTLTKELGEQLLASGRIPTPPPL